MATRRRSGVGSLAAKQRKKASNDAFAPEKRALDMGVVGGLLMIVIAVVWFVVGLAGGFIFFYPPILLVIGLFGVLKGVFTGNLAGRSPRRRKRRAKRSREAVDDGDDADELDDVHDGRPIAADDERLMRGSDEA